jgi:hypothetical protein
MLKIFALILPLYENPRNALLALLRTLIFNEDTFIDLRILITKVIKEMLVRTKTITPIIGLS